MQSAAKKKPHLRDFFAPKKTLAKKPAAASTMSFASPVPVSKISTEATPREAGRELKSPAVSPADSPGHVSPASHDALTDPPATVQAAGGASEYLTSALPSPLAAATSRATEPAAAAGVLPTAKIMLEIQEELNGIYSAHEARQDFIQFAAEHGCRVSGQLRAKGNGRCVDQVLAIMVQGSSMPCSSLAEKVHNMLAELAQSDGVIKVPASAAEIADRISGIADRKSYGAGESDREKMWVWEIKDLKLFEKPFDKVLKPAIIAARKERKVASVRIKLLAKMLKNLAKPDFPSTAKAREAYAKDSAKRSQLAQDSGSAASPAAKRGVSSEAEEAGSPKAIRRDGGVAQDSEKTAQELQEHEQKLELQKTQRETARAEEVKREQERQAMKAAEKAREKARKAEERERLKAQKITEKLEETQRLAGQKEVEKRRATEAKIAAAKQKEEKKVRLAKQKRDEKEQANKRKAEEEAAARAAEQKKAQSKTNMWANFGFAKVSKTASRPSVIASSETAANSHEPKRVYQKWDEGYAWKLTTTAAVGNKLSSGFETAVRSQTSDESLSDIVQKMRERQQQRARPSRARQRVKFLDFRGFDTLKNRPPWYGIMDESLTRSEVVTGRRPLAKEHEEIKDYDWDSEEDWEPDGEDIENSDGEEDKEDGEDEGDGFMVPDGTFSDDEGIEGGGDRLVGISTTSTTQAVVIMQGADLNSVSCHIKLHVSVVGPNAVSQYDCDINGVNMIEKEKLEEKRKLKAEEQRQKDEEKQRKMLTDVMLPDLVRIVHGTQKSKDKIVEEFLVQFPVVSKAQVVLKLQEIATKEKKADKEGPNAKKRWFVKPALLEQLGMTEMDEIMTDTWIQCQPNAAADSKRPRESEGGSQAKEQKLSYWAKHGVKTSPGQVCTQEQADRAKVTWGEFDSLLSQFLKSDSQASVPAAMEAAAELGKAATAATHDDLMSVWDMLTSTTDKESRSAASQSLRKLMLAIKDSGVSTQTRATLADWLTAAVANENLIFSIEPLLADELPVKLLASVCPTRQDAMPASGGDLTVQVLRLLRYIFAVRGADQGGAQIQLASTISKLKLEMRSPATDIGTFLIRCAAANQSGAICKYALALSYELWGAPLNADSASAAAEWFLVYVNTVKTSLTEENKPAVVYAALGMARLLTIGAVNAESTQLLDSTATHLGELLVQLPKHHILATAMVRVALHCCQEVEQALLCQDTSQAVEALRGLVETRGSTLSSGASCLADAVLRSYDIFTAKPGMMAEPNYSTTRLLNSVP